MLATGPQPDALENLEVPKNALCVAEVPQAGDSEKCWGWGMAGNTVLFLGVPISCCRGFLFGRCRNKHI